MVDERLVEYIKREEHDGYSDRQLHDFLLAKGYPEQAVTEAIAVARGPAKQAPAQPSPAQRPTQPASQQAPASQKNFPKRNVLVQVLLSFITFGIWSIVWLVRMSKDLKGNGYGEDLDPKMPGSSSSRSPTLSSSSSISCASRGRSPRPLASARRAWSSSTSSWASSA